MRFLLLILSCLLSFYANGAKPKLAACRNFETAAASGNSASAKLNSLLQAMWKYQMLEYPEWATYVGYPGQNDRVTDMSLAALERRKSDTLCKLKSLKKIPRSGLKGSDRINYDLALRGLDSAVANSRFDGQYLLLDHLGGLHLNIAEAGESMPQVTRQDYLNIIARLEKVPQTKAQIEILLREGLRRKATPVKMFLSRVPAQFDRVLTDKIEDSPIYKPFIKINASLTSKEQDEIQSRAREVISGQVYPALKELQAFVIKEYIPGARESIAWTSMPNGKAWYEFRVQEETTTSMTPDQLHELGLSEVKRLTGEMELIKNQVAFKGDLPAFNKFLLTDKQFYYTDKAQLMMGYRDIAKRIDPELPKLFKTLPRLTYGVKEMAAHKAAEAPAAYYQPGSLEAGRPGYFEANTHDLKARPKWAMEALTIHEAVPGHHFQISIAQEVKGLPEFRRYEGYTAFVEGWALYAESLGSEMGFYQDPYSRYGQLTYEMWRAVRLVVDTGLHAKEWTRQQAIDYFMSKMPKSQIEAEVEIDRYITWPGQALAYKVGELKFKELRSRATSALGERFDIRNFHDEVLRHGGLPLDVLEKSFNEWLEKEKRLTRSKT